MSSAADGGTGLVNRMASKASSLLAEQRVERELAPKRTVTGVSGMGIAVQAEPVITSSAAERSVPDFETDLGALGDLLAENRTGLLLTVDEIHVSDVDEIRHFGNVFQLVSVGRGRVMFADHTVRRFVEARAAAEGFTA
ncbi:MAG: hypothetical protein OXE79_06530 [Acidimicrobiaceae bacterium]|nr:hypothetical protein [Acidimicrobiaceae bacterium]